MIVWNCEETWAWLAPVGLECVRMAGIPAWLAIERSRIMLAAHEAPRESAKCHGAPGVKLQLIDIERMGGRGTPVAGGSAPGLYHDWLSAQAAGANGNGVPSSKFRYYVNNTAGGEVRTAVLVGRAEFLGAASARGTHAHC